jgi:SEC-C motif
MDFREKLESALTPLIAQLKGRLSSLPAAAVLNHYQLRIDTVKTNKSDVPDGFLFKWRYLWALQLSNPFSDADVNHDSESQFKSIDELTEQIFDVYGFGAMLEPGRSRGSEKEFLTRLGLALKVREPDILGFPEQVQSWAAARLRPFNDSYFLPTFGLRFDEILDWLRGLIGRSQSRLDALVTDLTSIYTDMEPIDTEFASGHLDIEAARKRSAGLRIGERMERNARQGDRMHLFSREELQCGVPDSAVQSLTKQFGIRAGEVQPEYVFPHHDNPLEYKTFVAFPDGAFYFLDPANAYRVVAKTFEKHILANDLLRDRYLRNRDRETERLVTENMRRVFPSAAIYPNYYLERGSHEKDLFVQEGNAVILVECKNSRLRAFKGTAVDLLNFQRDFKTSVQFGYEQASEVKQRILKSEESTFFDEKGKVWFSVKRSEVKRIYILCVTITPRGPFGTDLSYELKKPDGEPFPLAVNLFDLDTICRHLSEPGQFVAYLDARERLHGRARTGDELNYAGYFLKYGNLNLQNNTFLTDDFSGVFDRRWYKEHGIEVEEPSNPPVLTTMTRKGNRVLIEHSTGRKESFRVPAWMIESATGRPPIIMRGSDRNNPCPCGSGRKVKNCCGAT